MAFFKIFSGPSPDKIEQKGDALFSAEQWGSAKIAYERALHKLEKAAEDNTSHIQRLRVKISDACNALSREHLQNATALAEGGFFKDARELLQLAGEIAQSPVLKQNAADQHNRVDQMEAESRHAAKEDYEVFEAPAAPLSVDADEMPLLSEEDFTALCETLPPEVRQAYLNYGDYFKTGYIALNSGDFKAAVTLLELAAEQHPEPDSYIPLALATAYLNLENDSKAETVLQTFLAHHPDALPAYQLLCEIYWERRQFSNVDTLLAAVPNALIDTYAFMLLKGENLYQSGNLEDARLFYSDYLNHHQWDETVALALARIAEDMQNPDTALSLYEQVINRCTSCQSSADPLVRHKYAELRFENGSAGNDILEIYLALARELPEHAALYYQRISKIYADQGNLVEAERFKRFAKTG